MMKGDYVYMNGQACHILYVAKNAVIVESMVGRVRSGKWDSYKYIVHRSSLQRHPSPAVHGWIPKVDNKKTACSHGTPTDVLRTLADRMKERRVRSGA